MANGLHPDPSIATMHVSVSGPGGQEFARPLEKPTAHMERGSKIVMRPAGFRTSPEGQRAAACRQAPFRINVSGRGSPCNDWGFVNAPGIIFASAFRKTLKRTQKDPPLFRPGLPRPVSEKAFLAPRLQKDTAGWHHEGTTLAKYSLNIFFYVRPRSAHWSVRRPLTRYETFSSNNTLSSYADEVADSLPPD
jgi:hypothetical protein